jgi:hypothetical protein
VTNLKVRLKVRNRRKNSVVFSDRLIVVEFHSLLVKSNFCLCQSQNSYRKWINEMDGWTDKTSRFSAILYILYKLSLNCSSNHVDKLMVLTKSLLTELILVYSFNKLCLALFVAEVNLS